MDFLLLRRAAQAAYARAKMPGGISDWFRLSKTAHSEQAVATPPIKIEW
jgi:hypothetical protein